MPNHSLLPLALLSLLALPLAAQELKPDPPKVCDSCEEWTARERLDQRLAEERKGR